MRCPIYNDTKVMYNNVAAVGWRGARDECPPDDAAQEKGSVCVCALNGALFVWSAAAATGTAAAVVANPVHRPRAGKLLEAIVARRSSRRLTVPVSAPPNGGHPRRRRNDSGCSPRRRLQSMRRCSSQHLYQTGR